MDLQSLLRPGGSAFRLYLFALVYALAGSSGLLVVALQYRDFVWVLDIAFYSLMSAAVILLGAHALAAAFGRRLTGSWGLGIAVTLGCLVSQVVEMWIFENALDMAPHPMMSYWYRLGMVRGPLLWWGLGAAAWYAIKRAEAHAGQVSKAEIEGERLRASTAQARLQALQARVEPHFLFNTLAHVKWLYRRDGERGRRMLDRLIDYLHAALPRVRQSTTTLEQELQLAHAYLDIQQIRIGGRLAFTIEVPEEFAKLRFPPLMLLTLVENSIKHGIAPQTEGGTIAIRAHVEDDKLRIEVRDTGAGLRETKGSGMGLANVRARLAALFGAGARLVIEPNMPHGVVAAIEIPR
jgi:signal transduction histidine kinase